MKKRKVEIKKQLDSRVEEAWIGTFHKLFAKGVESVEHLILERFVNENEEKNYQDEIKFCFLKAAGELFKGEAKIDKITIGEIDELFQKNETLIELQEKFKIVFEKNYENQPTTAAWNAIHYLQEDVEKTKDFILKRFKNEDPKKNFSLEDQKTFFQKIKAIVDKQIFPDLIGKEERNEFKKLFANDEDLRALQKTLGITVAEVLGDTNNSEESLDEEY